MGAVTVKAWELLSLFEVEPELQEPGEPWDVNDALYRVRQGEVELSLAIAPAYRDVRIVLRHRDTRLFELNAMGVHDVIYSAEGGAETLEIQVSERDTITLRVKPHILLEQSVTLPE